MEPRFTLPAWADESNKCFHHLDDNACIFFWMSAAPWHTMWVDYGSSAEALERSKRHSWREVHGKRLPNGLWQSVEAVGQYIRVRYLPRGPVRKLSDWDELEVGRSILLHPQPDDRAFDLAEYRAASLRRLQRGHFEVQTRADQTLWITKHA